MASCRNRQGNSRTVAEVAVGVRAPAVQRAASRRFRTTNTKPSVRRVTQPEHSPHRASRFGPRVASRTARRRSPLAFRSPAVQRARPPTAAQRVEPTPRRASESCRIATSAVRSAPTIAPSALPTAVEPTLHAATQSAPAAPRLESSARRNEHRPSGCQRCNRPSRCVGHDRASACAGHRDDLQLPRRVTLLRREAFRSGES